MQIIKNKPKTGNIHNISQQSTSFAKLSESDVKKALEVFCFNALENYKPKNRINSFIGLFFQILIECRTKSDQDLQILIMGKEGSGKSGLGMVIGACAVPNFLENLEKSFFLASGEEVIRFFKYLKENFGSKKVPYFIDEAHNWMHVQEASTKESVRLKVYYRNGRISGTFGIHCTPNMTEIQPILIQRSDVIILLDPIDDQKNLGHGFIFMGDNKTMLATSLVARKNAGQYLPNIPSEIMSLCNVDANFTFQWSQEDIYQDYYLDLKGEGYDNFLDESIEILEKKHEKGNMVQINNNGGFESYYGRKIHKGGYGQKYDVVPEILYEDDFISYNVISSLTGMEYKQVSARVNNAKKGKGIDTVKPKKTVYVKVSDLHKVT